MKPIYKIAAVCAATVSLAVAVILTTIAPSRGACREYVVDDYRCQTADPAPLNARIRSTRQNVDPPYAKFIKDDNGNWVATGSTGGGIGDLLGINNLNDVANITTALNNLLPSKTGHATDVLTVSAGEAGVEWAAGGGGGDVVGPGAALPNTVALFSGGTGKQLGGSNIMVGGAGLNDILAGKYNSVDITGSNNPSLSVTGTTTIIGPNTGDNSANTLYANDYRAANFEPGIDYEAALGNPSADGQVLASTVGGGRSWITPGSATLTMPIRNESGATIPAYRAVYISGYNNGATLVALAVFNDPAKTEIVGVTNADIPTGSAGTIVTSGKTAWSSTTAPLAVGDSLYLWGNGTLAKLPPGPTGQVIGVARVTVSAISGEIDVKIADHYSYVSSRTNEDYVIGVSPPGGLFKVQDNGGHQSLIVSTGPGNEMIYTPGFIDVGVDLSVGGLIYAGGDITGANLSGTNTGNNAVNALYSGLVSNATHTGDATGSTALTVVKINGTQLSELGTGLLKNTTGTGVPSIAIGSDLPTHAHAPADVAGTAVVTADSRLSDTRNTTNPVTFNSSGGAAAGATFNGSVARTVDYSTVGAEPANANIQSHIANTSNPHSATATQVGAEAALGNPASSGYVLASTTGGARSWVAQGGGSMIYPGAGVAVSTGSAWGTSLDITGISDSTSTTSSTSAASSTAVKSAYDLATGKEASLGNPGTSGYVLSSTTGGTRSWIASGGGAPTGADKQVQFNNAGSAGVDPDFIYSTASKHLELGLASGDLGAICYGIHTTDETPEPGELITYAKRISGRALPRWCSPSGVDSFYQAFMGRSKVLAFKASGGSTTATGLGLTLTATSTATAATTAVTNTYTQLEKLEYLQTTAGTTAVAGFRTAGANLWRGNAAGLGGFHVVLRFGPATGVTTSTRRLFAGVAGSTSAPTDVNPSTLTQIVGMGYDAADNNMQIIANDGTGTATKTDLGASFVRPSADRTNMYELSLYCAPNGSTVEWEATNLTSGAVATGTVSAAGDLPTNTTFLGVRGYSSVGGTSSVTGLGLGSVYVEADN